MENEKFFSTYDVESDDEYDITSRPPTPGSSIETSEEIEAGRYVRMPLNRGVERQDRNGNSSVTELDESDKRSVPDIGPRCTNEDTATNRNSETAGSRSHEDSDRLSSLEKGLAELSRLLLEQRASEKPVAIDQSWAAPGYGVEIARPSSSVRMDHIPPFPTDVPSNGMWEAFNKYLEKFEIALAIYNISDPVKQAQYLFLAIGDDLQNIVRGAGLRPNLHDPDCYKKMVANISGYFRAMTDSAAEHEAFAKMKQERGESTVTFHARLMSKARLCGYSSKDQERFVRSQLLRGMMNQELARSARTFNYETSFIVQSAARSEAFDAEVRAGSSNNQVLAVKEYTPRTQKRSYAGQQRQQSDTVNKRRRNTAPTYKRDRCSRCDRPQHNGRVCPAVDRECRQCGRRGHFAATCRMKKLNRVEKVEPPPVIEDEKV